MRIAFLAALFLIAGVAKADKLLGEFLMVKPDNSLSATGVVATLNEVAQAVATAEGIAIQADIAQHTAQAVSNMMDDVSIIINSLEGVGYIRGYILDFGQGIGDVNTNVTATIVKFDPKVSNDLEYAYFDLYTFFSDEVEGFPRVVWQASLGRTNAWNVAQSVNVELTELVVNSTYYAEVYRNTVRVPLSHASAFFRVMAEAKQSVVGAYLPVRNGVSPGGREPLTAEFTDGTNTIKFVGGIRVMP